MGTRFHESALAELRGKEPDEVAAAAKRAAKEKPRALARVPRKVSDKATACTPPQRATLLAPPRWLDALTLLLYAYCFLLVLFLLNLHSTPPTPSMPEQPRGVLSAAFSRFRSQPQPPPPPDSDMPRFLFLAAVATATAIAAATALCSFKPRSQSAAAKKARRIQKRRATKSCVRPSLQPSREQINKLIKRSNEPVPATESLHRCEEACRDAVQNAIAGLGEGDKFTDTLWNPLEDEARVLYAHEGPVLDDCTVGVPDGWERLSNRCDCPVLISDGISVTDVRQGQIGDCFLITAMGSVAAARPDAIRSLFVAHDVELGIYGVRLFLNGAWQYVIVDDYVAVTQEGEGQTSLMYASSSDPNECWLPMLEKAIAKAVGCWENIDGGFTSWALEVLTGGLCVPADEIMLGEDGDLPDHDALFERINAQLMRGDVLGVSTGSDDGLRAGLEALGMGTETVGEGTAGEAVLGCGLVSGHAYSLLAVTEYQGTQLFQIRNPWGSGEWCGPWSDGSEEMSDEAKEALGHAGGDDGTFFMAAAEFTALWQSVAGVRLFDSSWQLQRAQVDAARSNHHPSSSLEHTSSRRPVVTPHPSHTPCRATSPKIQRCGACSSSPHRRRWRRSWCSRSPTGTCSTRRSTTSQVTSSARWITAITRCCARS